MPLIKPIFYKGKATHKYATTDGEILDENLFPLRYYESGSGYFTVALCSGHTSKGKPTTVRAYVHRLIAEAFCSNPENLTQVKPSALSVNVSTKRLQKKLDTQSLNSYNSTTACMSFGLCGQYTFGLTLD